MGANDNYCRLCHFETECSKDEIDSVAESMGGIDQAFNLAKITAYVAGFIECMLIRQTVLSSLCDKHSAFFSTYISITLRIAEKVASGRSDNGVAKEAVQEVVSDINKAYRESLS